MELIFDLFMIILTIIIIIIIRKFFEKFLKHNKKNFVNISDKTKKNLDSNQINNDSEKENKGNIYNNSINETKKITEINKKIINYSPLSNQIYNNTISENIPYNSYDDKKVYNYLYQLPFIKNRLIILDTEVSGISTLDHIIELCALEMINGKLTSQYYHSFLNPKKRLNSSIIKKHKIPKTVFKYSYEKERKIFEEFLNFVDDSIIIAHNAIYDMEKINHELNYYNLPLIDKFQFRCSMRIFFDKFRNFSNKFSKLKECCNFLNIKYDEDNLHLAYYDAYYLGKIMEAIYSKEYNEILINKNNNLINNNKNVENNEDEQFDNELKNINVNYSISAGNTKKTTFDELIKENIDEIYKELEEEETNKIIEKILKDEDKNNSFDKFVNENIDEVFNCLKNEEAKEET